MANRRAGAWHISSTTLSTINTPFSQSSSIAGSENCTIGMPEAALAQPPILSVTRCGAWSVATTAIRPSVSAARKASRSARAFTAGLHFIWVPSVR